jgi:predicted RNase H-like nuclease (RuvC/YqgF family)
MQYSPNIEQAARIENYKQFFIDREKEINGLDNRITELEKQLKEAKEQVEGMEANCYTPDEIRVIEEAAYHAGKVGGYD